MTSQKNKVELFNDLEVIKNIIESTLNENEEIFQLEIMDNNENLNPKNLVADKLIQGVLKFNTISMTGANDGSEIKNVSVQLLLPLDDNSTKNNNEIIRAVKSLNGVMFEINNDIGILFNSINLLDNYKLSKPINGIEYELITLTATITTSQHYLRGEDEWIKVNGNLLKGKININKTVQKTLDGSVKGYASLVQGNKTNGIQIVLDVDLLFYKNDALHRQLLEECEENNIYEVEYFNGYFTKKYDMIVANITTSSIVGDTKKGKITFAIGDIE